jgi:PilZ domain-containing protein/PBS lyase HEAT-like repeat-containing protein
VKYVRLYGFEHRRTQMQFEMAWEELRAAVPKRHGSVVLGVSEDKLLLDGVPVETGHAERGFAQLLTAAGVGSIQFFSEVTVEEFEDFVRAFSFSSARAQDFAAHIRHAFPEDKGAVRINQVKFIAADPAAADVTAAAQLAANALSPEVKQWLSQPEKLVQLIAAAEGAEGSPNSANDAQLSFDLGVESETTAESLDARSIPSDTPFPLSEKETIDALRLLTRFGELGAQPVPKPELIGLELHRSEESIRNTVLGMLDELSALHDAKSDKPLLMRAAEQLAIRYALERFQSGDLKVNAVHQLLEQMGTQMGNLRKILSHHEQRMSKAGLVVESHADLLDRMFWAELPEHDKKKALLSEDAACVPARNVRQYVELLLERGDRETAAAILSNYCSQVGSKERDYREKVATGITQLADLLPAVNGNVLGETAQRLGDALAKESDPEIESLLSAAFVRLGSEAGQRKQYHAIAQACETMDYLASRRPALEKELRSRIGVEGRLPEFIEDALAEQRVGADLLGVLHRNLQASTEHLAERFFRSMRREECDRIVDLVQELGVSATNYLREMLHTGPQRQAVSSVGLLSRLDVPGLLEFLPLRLPTWNRFYHDVIVRQIAYGAAPDRGRTLLEILEILDPAVVPQTLDEIGMSGDRSAAPPLIVMAGAGETQGRSPLLQLKAIEALGRLREPDAVPVLRNLFEAKKMFKWQHHRELRIAAAQALARIDPRYATQIMADSGLEPGELAIGPLDSAPACPWVRQRRYERIVLRKTVPATISSSWGRSTLAVRELSLGGGMGTKEDSLRIGSDADLDIQIGMRHIRAQVLLRRARVNEVGFEFVNTDLESRHRLRHVLMDSLEHAPEGKNGKWSYERRGN